MSKDSYINAARAMSESWSKFSKDYLKELSVMIENKDFADESNRADLIKERDAIVVAWSDMDNAIKRHRDSL